MGGKSYQRHKTKYPGVFFRVGQRIGGQGQEKIFYIVFKKDGKVVEEKVGRQFADRMTEAKASGIRGERIEGKRQSRKEIRVAEKARQEAAANRPTINRLWEKYQEGRTLKGLAQDRSRFDLYLKPVIGHKEPGEVTELDKQVITRKMKTLSIQTKAHVWRLLRRLIRAEAGEATWKTVAKNANLSKKELPKKINNQVENLFSDEMLAKYLTAVDEDHDPVVKAVIKLAMYTGMRRGEILNLKWQDIDQEKGFVRLPDPKSGQLERIPLSPMAVEVIKQIPHRDESELLFPGRKGKPRPDIKRQIKRIKERAGLPEGYRPLHDLRANFATMLANSGKVDIYMLQKLLCHKDPATTQRYAHLIDTARKEAAELASDLFNQAVENGKATLKKSSKDDQAETA